MFEQRRIEKAGSEIALRLPPEEQALLIELARELHAALDGEQAAPSLRRLFPPAYEDDQDERAYRELMGGELLDGRRESLELLSRTVGRERLSGEQAEAWLRALNDLRLVLGTRIEVSEEALLNDIDPRDPRASGLAVYAYLSWLQEQLVEALSP